MKSLESLVEVLSTPALDGRVERLIDRVKELETENKRLRDAVLTIRQAVALSTDFVGSTSESGSDEGGAKGDMVKQTAPSQPLPSPQSSPQPSPPPWEAWVAPMQNEMPGFSTPDPWPSPVRDCPVLVLPPTPAQFSFPCDDSSAYSLLQYL